jgi:hypothetical protein
MATSRCFAGRQRGASNGKKTGHTDPLGRRVLATAETLLEAGPDCILQLELALLVLASHCFGLARLFAGEKSGNGLVGETAQCQCLVYHLGIVGRIRNDSS